MVEIFDIEEFEKVVKESETLSEVLRKLGKEVNGGNFRTLRKRMNSLGITFPKRLTREEYDKNPKYCLNCGCKIPYEHRRNKYCSSSCAATVNNKNFPKKKVSFKTREYPEVRKYKENVLYCIVCGKPLTGNQKKILLTGV